MNLPHLNGRNSGERGLPPARTPRSVQINPDGPDLEVLRDVYAF